MDSILYGDIVKDINRATAQNALVAHGNRWKLYQQAQNGRDGSSSNCSGKNYSRVDLPDTMAFIDNTRNLIATRYNGQQNIQPLNNAQLPCGNCPQPQPLPQPCPAQQVSYQPVASCLPVPCPATSCANLCPGSGNPAFIQNSGVFTTTTAGTAVITALIAPGSSFTVTGSYTAAPGICIPSAGQIVLLTTDTSGLAVGTAAIPAGGFPIAGTTAEILGVVTNVILPNGAATGSISVYVLFTNLFAVTAVGPPPTLVPATVLAFATGTSTNFLVDSVVEGPVVSGTFH
jgi:hypothetical protein